MKNMLSSYCRVTVFGFLISLALLTTSCNNDPGTATLQVRLTDAPGDYDEVNIDIQDVQVNSDASSNSGWKSLDVKRKGVYNLLKLTNGLDTLLGDIQLPEGSVNQIRLVLGTNNTIKVSGISYPLSTPSAQQSGLKIQIHTELKAGVVYSILLDFDAAKSIVKTGGGDFKLKPVIRSIVEAESGAIKGIISPVAASPAVYAINGQDTVATSFADQLSGKFLLKGVPAGTYTIRFAPGTGYVASTKSSVAVTVGSVTDLGTILIAQ